MPRNSVYASLPSPSSVSELIEGESQDEWRLRRIYCSFLKAGVRSGLFKGGNTTVCTEKAR